jgi:hypothetical protein
MPIKNENFEIKLKELKKQNKEFLKIEYYIGKNNEFERIKKLKK